MSNVHAAERKENVIFATLHHAFKLRREIRALCLRDFSYKFREKKGETEIQIERRKQFERAELDKEVDCVVDILRSITSHITLANKINPETWPEYTERRLHQTLAIAECGRLSAEIQFAIEDFATDVNQFIPIDKMISYQIYLLKRWRQSDNKIKDRLPDSPAAISQKSK